MREPQGRRPTAAKSGGGLLVWHFDLTLAFGDEWACGTRRAPDPVAQGNTSIAGAFETFVSRRIPIGDGAWKF